MPLATEASTKCQAEKRYVNGHAWQLVPTRYRQIGEVHLRVIDERPDV
jgi:hypothetical protein